MFDVVHIDPDNPRNPDDQARLRDTAIWLMCKIDSLVITQNDEEITADVAEERLGLVGGLGLAVKYAVLVGRLQQVISTARVYQVELPPEAIEYAKSKIIEKLYYGASNLREHQRVGEQGDREAGIINETVRRYTQYQPLGN